MFMLCSIDSADSSVRQVNDQALEKAGFSKCNPRFCTTALLAITNCKRQEKLWFSPRRNHPPVDVSHAARPAQRHGHIELRAEHFNRLRYAGLAAGAEAIDIGAADHARARAERERAQHVLAGADSAVEHHLDLAAHRFDD